MLSELIVLKYFLTFTVMKQNSNCYIGLFIPDEDSLLKSLVQLITSIESGSWIFISDEKPRKKVKALFKQGSITFNEGQILLSSEFKLREPVVRAKPVIEALAEKIKSTESQNLLIFVEMTWAVRTPSGDIYLRELQGAFQDFLNQNPQLTIVCIYNECILLDDQLLIGLASHPLIYATDKLKVNPYYLPPKIQIHNRIRERFDYLLGNIDENHKALLAKKNNSIFEKSYSQERTLSTNLSKSDEGRWKIRCFGELRIYRENGELIDWNTKSGATKKLKAVFAYLLLKGKKGASGERIADLLWPDAETTEIAMNRLYHSIRFLRQVLGGDSSLGKDDSFIVNQNSIYYLQLPYDSWIDLPMFSELCVKGKIHAQNDEFEQAKVCYTSAERLYSGQLFEDIPLKYTENGDDDWCWSKRFWYKEMYQKLLYSLASLNRKLEDYANAISYADRALADDPNLEEAHKEKMLALASLKRYDALDRQFKVYTESLKKFNLGAASPALKDLYNDLLRNTKY